MEVKRSVAAAGSVLATTLTVGEAVNIGQSFKSRLESKSIPEPGIGVLDK
jgi:hypothetical protein